MNLSEQIKERSLFYCFPASAVVSVLIVIWTYDEYHDFGSLPFDALSSISGRTWLSNAEVRLAMLILEEVGVIKREVAFRLCDEMREWRHDDPNGAEVFKFLGVEAL